MPLKRVCPRCNTVIDYTSKYCIECSKVAHKYKAESNKAYDKNVRRAIDSKYDSFYHSKEWKRAVNLVKNKYKALDIYSYYVLKQIEYGNISHHIKLLKTDEGWTSRLDIDGLIYLTNANHEFIHSLYDKDYEGTKKILYELINKYNNEFK